MSVKHDHLLEALLNLKATLETGDPFTAQAATDHVLHLLGATTDPAADSRLRPIFAQCQVLADKLKASLQHDLQATAASSRASLAYEREAREAP